MSGPEIQKRQLINQFFANRPTTDDERKTTVTKLVSALEFVSKQKKYAGQPLVDLAHDALMSNSIFGTKEPGELSVLKDPKLLPGLFTIARTYENLTPADLLTLLNVAQIDQPTTESEKIPPSVETVKNEPATQTILNFMPLETQTISIGDLLTNVIAFHPEENDLVNSDEEAVG